MGRDWQLRVKQLLSSIKMRGKFEEQYIFQVPSDGEGERWSDEEIKSCCLGNFSERLWSTLGCPGHLEPEHQLRGGGMSPAGQTVQGDRNRSPWTTHPGWVPIMDHLPNDTKAADSSIFREGRANRTKLIHLHPLPPPPRNPSICTHLWQHQTMIFTSQFVHLRYN